MKLTKIIKQIFLTIFTFAFFVVAASAQSSIEQAVRSANDRFSDIKNRSNEMQRVERDANKPVAKNDAQTLKFPEIKEDFEQIQIIGDNLYQITENTKTTVNYADVSKFAAEINHRAARLNSNLFPAEPEQKQEEKNKIQIVEQQDIKMLLDNLDKYLNNFVHSSIFQNVNLVNSNDSLAAQKDLETVIKISSSIKEKAKELAKENAKK